jgi:hypothetical protein
MLATLKNTLIYLSMKVIFLNGRYNKPNIFGKKKFHITARRNKMFLKHSI